MRGLLFSFILTCLGSTVALTIDLDEFRSTFVQDPEVINTEELVVTVTPGTTEDELKSILAETNDFVVAEKLSLQGETYYRLVINEVIENLNEELGLRDDDSRIGTLRSNDKISTVEVIRTTSYNEHQLETSDPEVENIFYLVKEALRVRNNHKIQYAWEAGFTGQDKIVAVVDTEAQIRHTDLGNVDASLCYDYVNGDNDPTPATDSIKHGTTVLGIIGATKGNNECQVGVAYSATLAAIALIGSDVPDFKINQAWGHVSSADIYCSSFGPGVKSGFISTDQYAIDNSIQNGRRGKGTIFVFSAGNDDIQGNSNAWSPRASIYTISVGGLDGKSIAPYSVYGTNIMVSGFGGYHFDHLITSTQPNDGCSGESFAGTSYSASIVSGIIALALQANNELTWRDVQHLLVRSAARYRFKDTSLKTRWTRNGRGLFYNPRAGFGILDAKKMVELASNWQQVGTMLECDTGYSVPKRNSTNSRFRQDVVVMDKGCVLRFLENILVLVEFEQTFFRGTVELRVISPQGTRIMFLNERPQDTRRDPGQSTSSWIFKVVSFWGERAKGRWRLQYRSINPRVEVTIKRWAVVAYGTATYPGKRGGGSLVL